MRGLVTDSLCVAAVSVFNILKNPTILLALVSLGLFIGMPYLINTSKENLRA
jgi:ER membrane protein complex subunit 7